MTNIFNDQDGRCHICGRQTDYVLKIKLAGESNVFLPTCENHVPLNIELVERDRMIEEILENTIYKIDLQKKLFELCQAEEVETCIKD